MALPAVQLSLLADVLPMTVKLLGIAHPNYPNGSQVAPGAPLNLDQVKKLVFQADYEIALLIAGNQSHPFQTLFAVAETDFLNDGARIPASAVNHTKVTLKYNNSSKLGQIRDYSRIKRIKENPTVYGSPKYIYAISAGNIHFANASVTGKLEFPVVVKDLSLAVLLSPLAYFWANIAGAITKAALPGFNDSHRRYWANMWTLYAREITAGAVSIPEPEQLERLGT